MESISIDHTNSALMNICDPIDETYRIPLENSSEWKKHLEEEGFVVLSGVISQERAQYYILEMLKCLKVLSENRLDIENPKSWSKGKSFPYMLHGGMVQYVGHSQFQWDLREEVSEVFSQIWGVDKFDLATSFDGFCFMSGEKHYKSRPDNSFIHTDQSPNREGVWSYQGLVNLFDCDSESGGFVCSPKTHKLHRQYFTSRYDLSDKKFKGDWYAFTDEEKEKETFLKETLKVNCRAGDMILWDSRTFHCNTVPIKKVSRACVYICMLPKSHVSEEIRTKRKITFEKRRCSNHHPGNGFKMFPATPRWVDPKLYKQLISNFSDNIQLSDLQKSLACID